MIFLSDKRGAPSNNGTKSSQKPFPPTWLAPLVAEIQSSVDKARAFRRCLISSILRRFYMGKPLKAPRKCILSEPYGKRLGILSLNHWHTDRSTKAAHVKPQKQLVAPRDAGRFAYLCSAHVWSTACSQPPDPPTRSVDRANPQLGCAQARELCKP